MREIRLADWQRKPNYLAIVQAVECTVCGAPIHQPCRNISVSSRTLAAAIPRNELHMERVWLGIEVQIDAEAREKANSENEEEKEGKK